MSAPDLILAIDQGTTSSRAILYDHDCKVVSLAQSALPQHFPQPGWVWHDAAEIWQSVLACLDRLEANQSRIAGIGITNQRETTILWDRATGEPTGPAIVWQSRESAPGVRGIGERGMTERYREITGLVPDAYFSATKLALMLDRDPELRRKAEAGDLRFGTVDSWLIWKLTSGTTHVTDVTNASRTMLFDIAKREWSDELLRDLSIPESLLPTVVSSSETIAKASIHQLEGVPISGIAGDQHAALFGQCCFQAGQAKNTYGTGSFMLMNVGSSPIKSAKGLLSTIAWERNGQLEYALEGSIFVTGAAVQWLRDGLGIIKSSSDIETMAASVPDTGGVVFVPALTGLGAPHWDSQAAGLLIGLTRGTTSAHIARATLQAIAWQVADLVDLIASESGIPITELKVDGGASRNDLLMQMQADLLGVPVVRPVDIEVTALGAAALAGLGVGFWQSEAELLANVETDKIFQPADPPSIDPAERARWQEAVERSKGWWSR